MLATLNAIKGTKNSGHCKKGLPGNTIYFQKKKKKNFCIEQTPSWYVINLCQICSKEGNSLIIPMRQTNTNPLGVSNNKKKKLFSIHSYSRYYFLLVMIGPVGYLLLDVFFLGNYKRL